MANSPESSELLPGADVFDAAGHRGKLASLRQVQGETQATIETVDGMHVLMPARLLTREPGGGYRLPFSIETAAAYGHAQLRLPVMEEHLHVDKREVDTGRGVRIRKTIVEHEQQVDENLFQDELSIEHVPIDQVVSGPMPQTRYEGDTLVVPVLEEVLVVQKQVLLREEVRIHRYRREMRMNQAVPLKSEQISVERFEEGGRHD